MYAHITHVHRQKQGSPVLGRNLTEVKQPGLGLRSGTDWVSQHQTQQNYSLTHLNSRQNLKFFKQPILLFHSKVSISSKQNPFFPSSPPPPRKNCWIASFFLPIAHSYSRSGIDFWYYPFCLSQIVLHFPLRIAEISPTNDYSYHCSQRFAWGREFSRS